MIQIFLDLETIVHHNIVSFFLLKHWQLEALEAQIIDNLSDITVRISMRHYLGTNQGIISTRELM